MQSSTNDIFQDWLGYPDLLGGTCFCALGWSAFCAMCCISSDAGVQTKSLWWRKVCGKQAAPQGPDPNSHTCLVKEHNKLLQKPNKHLGNAFLILEATASHCAHTKRCVYAEDVRPGTRTRLGKVKVGFAQLSAYAEVCKCICAPTPFLAWENA